VQSLVQHIVRQGVYASSDIAVLTPYVGQLQKLRLAMSSSFQIVLSDRDLDTLAKDGFEVSLADTGTAVTTKQPIMKKTLTDCLRLATVDNFQGEEAKIVIVSLVRSNAEQKVGFLRTTNRINVLLSRAKNGMYLIGNSETYSKVPMWEKVIEMLRATDSIGEKLALCCPRHKETELLVSTPEDFERKSPEGGCTRTCDRRLNLCGHQCPAPCHSDAMHQVFQCPQACERLHEPCKHDCKKTCGEACGNCLIKIDLVELPCGHIQDGVRCHMLQDLSVVYCLRLVQKKVPGCGHKVKVLCHTDVEKKTYRCTQPCGQLMECGHACSGSCSDCNNLESAHVSHQKCEVVCGRRFGSCNHTCEKSCHSGKPCQHCEKNCEVCADLFRGNTSLIS
jgi:AAA domain